MLIWYLFIYIWVQVSLKPPLWAFAQSFFSASNAQFLLSLPVFFIKYIHFNHRNPEWQKIQLPRFGKVHDYFSDLVSAVSEGWIEAKSYTIAQFKTISGSSWKTQNQCLSSAFFFDYKMEMRIVYISFSSCED